MMNIKTILITLVILTCFAGVSSATVATPEDLSNTTGAGWVQWHWIDGAGLPTFYDTDTYNVSQTYGSTTTWFNGTTNEYIKWSELSGESVTIIIYAYNNTYNELSDSVTDTVTVPAIPIIQPMFLNIVNLISAITPLFTSILDLAIAVFPLIIAMAFLVGLVLLISRIFNKSLKFGGKK